MRWNVPALLLFVIIVLVGAVLFDWNPNVPRLGESEDVSWLDVDEDLEEALTSFERGDVTLAIEQFTSVAEAGNPLAQSFLGVLFADGFGVATDHCRALEWFERAADNDDALATFELGMAYLFGDCVSVDLDEAENHFKAVVKLGEAAG